MSRPRCIKIVGFCGDQRTWICVLCENFTNQYVFFIVFEKCQLSKNITYRICLRTAWTRKNRGLLPPSTGPQPAPIGRGDGWKFCVDDNAAATRSRHQSARFAATGRRRLVSFGADHRWLADVRDLCPCTHKSFLPIFSRPRARVPSAQCPPFVRKTVGELPNRPLSHLSTHRCVNMIIVVRPVSTAASVGRYVVKSNQPETYDEPVAKTETDIIASVIVRKISKNYALYNPVIKKKITGGGNFLFVLL